jgi:hypothetical protein
MFKVASKTTGIISLLAVSTFCACGSDSEGPSGVTSGVDGSRPVNMLAPGDAQKLCDAVARYGTSRVSRDSVRRAVCVGLTALQIANPPTVAQCNDSVAQCVMMAAQTTGGTTVGATPACTAGVPPTNCTATVAELETCSTALIDQAANALASVTCDLWGLPPAEAAKRIMDAQNRPALAECAPIRQKCPAFLGQAAQAPQS